jgi:hypothetical protein
MGAPAQGELVGSGWSSDLFGRAGQMIQQNTPTPMQTANQFHQRGIILRPYRH